MSDLDNLFYGNDLIEVVAALPKEVETLSGRRILIAGGGGFLGRYFLAIFDHLNDQVLDEPCQICILDNFKVTNPTLVGTLGEWGETFAVDICRDPLPEGHFDWIIHAAGIASPYYYRAYPLETLEVATVGTQRLLERAKQTHAKFLYFSSSEIYGDPDPTHVPTLESYRGNVSTLGPRACYDEGKRVGETYCYIYHDYYGVHTSIVRPFNVYGPGMQKSDYRVMPNFAAQIAAEKPLMIYGDGQQTRTFCYIVDAMIGFFRVLLKGVPGEVYNIGNPNPEVSMNDLAAAFAKISPNSVTVQATEYPDSYPADEPMRRCPDIRKASLQLDYDPQVGLEEGVRRFLEWALPRYSTEDG